jgi:hypothetical protein
MCIFLNESCGVRTSTLRMHGAGNPERIKSSSGAFCARFSTDVHTQIPFEPLRLARLIRGVASLVFEASINYLSVNSRESAMA